MNKILLKTIAGIAALSTIIAGGAIASNTTFAATSYSSGTSLSQGTSQSQGTSTSSTSKPKVTNVKLTSSTFKSKVTCSCGQTTIDINISNKSNAKSTITVKYAGNYNMGISQSAHSNNKVSELTKYGFTTKETHNHTYTWTMYPKATKDKYLRQVMTSSHVVTAKLKGKVDKKYGKNLTVETIANNVTGNSKTTTTDKLYLNKKTGNYVTNTSSFTDKIGTKNTYCCDECLLTANNLGTTISVTTPCCNKKIVINGRTAKIKSCKTSNLDPEIYDTSYIYDREKEFSQSSTSSVVGTATVEQGKELVGSVSNSSISIN